MPRNQGTSRKGKPKKNERAAGMGRALQKAKGRRHTPSSSTGGMAMRQGVESVNVQHEDNRASVLDMNDLDDFLIQAEMANREFASEREQVVVLDETAQAASDERKETNIRWSDQSQPFRSAFAFQELSVPRRPPWDETTTPEELDKREKESFLNWRRAIAKKEEEIILSSQNSLGVTPFEKNLEIWRQLWRVMERSSCIVQVVDARNPLFYLSEDLKACATKELGKPMLLLINKSDYLTATQRQAWNTYFSDPEHPWQHVFFSAHEQQEELDRAAAIAAQMEVSDPGIELSVDGSDDEDVDDEESASSPQASPVRTSQPSSGDVLSNFGVQKPLSREELLEWLLVFADKNDCDVDSKYDRIPFGMVGFPNVGKSSVINVLMGNTKNAHGVVRVGVAAQPGKTKHFQTLLLPDKDNMLLCDCPGLVFPSFVNNTADLIAAGVFPIAQMRDPWPVVNLLCRRIPREVLNAQYGIQIPLPNADAMLEAKEDASIPPPTAEEFLTTYCVARSMLASASGVPDFQRASRIVIKEYAAGKLLYCHAPPNTDSERFQKETFATAIRNTKKLQQRLVMDGGHAEISTIARGDWEHDERSEEDESDEEYDMLQELLVSDTDFASQAGGGNRRNGTNPSRKKKWGKKGRKLRDNDPYGCHSSPDERMLAEGRMDTRSAGVTVKAGKYGRKGYVRPTTYGGARSATY